MSKATLTLAVSLAMLLSTSVSADGGNAPAFRAELSGAQEVPEVGTGTSGRVTLMFDSALSEARFVLRVENGTGVTQAHFHCSRPGANGPVVVFLLGFIPGGVDVDGELASGTMKNADITAIGANCVPSIGRPVNNIASLAFAARDGLIYANVHTAANPGGEVRGQLLEVDDDDD